MVLGGDGTLNEAANGLAGTGTRAGRAARRLDQRVRPHDRPARTTRSRPPATCSTRSADGSIRRVGPRLGQRPLLPLPRRHGLRRRGRRPGRAPRRAQALRRPPAVRLRRVRHRGSATTTAAGRASRCTSPTARSSTTATSRICLNTNPYTYLGNRPLDLAPEADARSRPRAGDAPHAAASRTIAAHRRLGARRRRRDLRSSRWIDHRDRPHRADRRRATARSRTRSTATTSATPSASSSATSPTVLDLVHAAVTAPPDASSGAESATRQRATSGTLVTMRVDAEVGELSACARARRTVQVLTARPAAWARRDERLVDERMVRVDRDVAARGGRSISAAGVVDRGRAARRSAAPAPSSWHPVDGRQVEARDEVATVVELAAAPRAAATTRRRPAARWGRSPGRRASS